MRKTFCYSMIFLCALIDSCSSKPEIEYNQELSKHISIAYLKSQYLGHPHLIDQDVYIEGVVVSSDRCLNIYKMLVLEDATGAIEVKLDASELFETYKYGTTVQVRCNSLILGSFAGTIQLGARSSDLTIEVGEVAAELIKSYLWLVDVLPVEVVAHSVSIAGLSARMISMPVEFVNVQFIDEEIMLTWCEPERSTDRHLIDAMGDTLIVRTRADAIFAREALPRGRGNIEGILGYFNGKFQLRVVDNYKMLFDKPRI